MLHARSVRGINLTRIPSIKNLGTRSYPGQICRIMEANVSPLDSSPLPFLHLMQQLKHLPRTGWLRTVKDPESVASHSCRLALLGLFAPVSLDFPAVFFPRTYDFL